MAGVLKDSKTRWLGQIPTDWDMVRVKDCFDRKNKKANQKDPVVLSLARSGVKIRDIASNEGQLAADYTNYNPVAKDDILINPMDLVSGDNCNISKVEGVISPAYVNLRYKKGINPRFYNYYFKLQYWLGAFFAHGYGVSFDNRWTLSYETLSKYPIVLPPSEEQEKIADFLDEKCAEIDNLSEDIQKQIEILNDYKKSVITRAVTKGLDPNAEMKESGIDYLGKYPMNWKLSRVKFNLKEPMKYGATESGVEYSEDLPRYIRITDITSDNKLKDDGKLSLTWQQAKRYMLSSDTVLFARSGGTVGKTFYYRPSYGKAAFAGYLISAIPNEKKMLTEWLYFYTLSNAYWEWANQIFTQATIQNIGADKYSNLPITAPDIETQKTIISYLTNRCSEIDESIALKQNQLDRLATYKKSIIYEYVTGKKRVKGAL